MFLNKASYEKLLEKGYYSTLIKNNTLKLIALNTMACDIKNLFLINDPTDPGDML